MPVDDAEVRRLMLADFTADSAVRIPDGPRGWGISPVDAEDGTGRAPRPVLEDYLRLLRGPGVELSSPGEGRARSIKVRSGGVLIYWGPGTLNMIDDGLGGLSVSVTVVHAPSRRQKNLVLSGPLVHGASASVEFRDDPVAPGDVDPDHVPCPVPDTVTLELEVPPGVAEFLRAEMNRGPGGPAVDVDRAARGLPYRDALVEAFGLPGDLVSGPDDDRLAQVRDLSARIRGSLEGAGEAVGRAAEGIRAFQDAVGLQDELRAALGFDDQDALIESTRSEFPYDPHDYGRRYAGGSPMHWTPPADGAEVPKWLA